MKVQEQRYWVVVEPDGSYRAVEEDMTATSKLPQLYELIRGDIIDIARIGGSIAGHPLLAIVHDEGLLRPEEYPMNRRLLGYAGPVVIGTEMEVAVTDGEDQYTEKETVGFPKDASDRIIRDIMNCPVIAEEQAEKIREERLKFGFITTTFSK